MTVFGAVGTRSAVALFRSEIEGVGDGWVGVDRALSRLSRQLSEHAESAPYPHFAVALRDVAASLELDLRRVAARLADFGRNSEINGADTVSEGRSSWDRLRVSQEDLRALLRQFGQLIIRWDDEEPTDAALAREVRDHLLRHRAALGDLLARADPHALN